MTGPRVYSPDNPFAQQATAPVTYSPDNPFAPKPGLRPLTPLRGSMAPAEAVIQPTGPRAEPSTTLGKILEAPFRMAEGGPMTVAQMAAAPAMAAGKGAAFMGQAAAETTLPDDIRARALALPGRISEEEAAISAAQLAVPMVAGPAETLIGRALARGIGSRAAAIAARTATGAGIGAVYTPDEPLVGGALGALAGGIHATAAGDRALARRYVENPPGETTATTKMGARALPAGPDFEVRANTSEAPVPSLPAPQAPKLLPRLRPVAPEELVAPWEKRAPAPISTAAKAAPAPAPNFDFAEFSDEAPQTTARATARTAAGRLMPNLKKATPEQLAGEYRTLLDRHAADEAYVAAIESHPALMAHHEMLGGAVNVKGGSMREDARGVLEEAGLKPDEIKQYAFARVQVENRAKSIAKVEAELTRRGIDHGDAYWMGDGETAPGTVGEPRARFGTPKPTTPEQRARYEALRQSVMQSLEVGKIRQAQLEQPKGPPDLAPAMDREGRVGERKPKYLKTAPSLFAPDNPSMFEGPANMDETSVGQRASAPVEPEAPKVRNAAELTAGEDQGTLFERRPRYGSFEMRRMQQRADEQGIDVRAAGMNDTATLPSDPGVKMGLLTDENLSEMSRAWVRDYMNPAHPPEYIKVLEADRGALDAEIARRIKDSGDGRVREAPAKYALQAAGAEGFPARLYSRVAKAIDAAPFEKGTADQWRAHLSKNVPASEREYSGLDAFLSGRPKGTLTRQEVAAAFNAGRIRLTETTLGGDNSKDTVVERMTAAEELRQELLQIGPQEGALIDSVLNDLRSHPNLTVQQVLHDHSLPRRPSLIQPMEAYRRSFQLENGNPPTRFHGWKVPGGANYREHVLSLERSASPLEQAQKDVEDTHTALVTYLTTTQEFTPSGAREYALDAARSGLSPSQLRALREHPEEQRLVDALQEAYTRRHELSDPELAGSSAQNSFSSTHWPGIRNPLVHVRTTDHVLANGENALLVEEIQSDWHQKGRKQGYKPAGYSQAALDKQINTLNAELSRLAALADGSTEKGLEASRQYTAVMAQRDALSRQYRDAAGAMPDAPLKKTEQWAELGLKKAIDEAVRGNYDRVVLADGETNAAHYDLTKHVDELSYDPETKRLVARKNGTSIHEGTYDPRALVDVVGKDAADKLLATPVTAHNERIATLRSDMADIRAERQKISDKLDTSDAAKTVAATHGRAVRAVQMLDDFGFDNPGEALGAVLRNADWEERFDVTNELESFYNPRTGTTHPPRITKSDLLPLRQWRAAKIRAGDENYATGPDLTELDARERRIQKELEPLVRESGKHLLVGQQLKVGGAGMKAFYDKMLPNMIKDYGKTLGVKIEIEPVDMGKKVLTPAEIDDQAMLQGYRRTGVGQVLTEVGEQIHSMAGEWQWPAALAHLEARGDYAPSDIAGARSVLEKMDAERSGETKTFLSFKVTPELRAKVAGEGQRLAEPKPNYDQLDAFTAQQLDAFSKPAAIEARQKHVYGSVVKAKKAIASVTKHAGKFATQYPPRAPTPAGRLSLIAGRPVKGSLVHIVGQRIETPREIAQALYPFRSPLTERFFTIVHAADGTVASATIDTSGATGYVAPYGGDIERFAAEIAARAARTDAKEVTIAHNHPSGDPTPSRDDDGFMRYLGSLLESKYRIHLRGQLVINHKTAIWMYPESGDLGLGIATRHIDVSSSGTDWTKGDGRRVSGPNDIVNIVGPGGGNGGLHVVYFDGQLRVLALEAHNPSALKTIKTWLPAHAKGMGSGNVVLVGPKGSSAEMLRAVQDAKMGVAVRDILTITPGVVGAPSFTSEEARGTLSGEAAERTPAEERKAFRRLSEPRASYGGATGLSGLEQPGAIRERGPEYRRARAAGIASGLTPEQADAYAAAAKDIDFDGAKAVAQAKAEAGGIRTRLRRWADAAADQTRAIDRLGRAAVERGMPPEKAPEYELALSYNSDDTIRRALYNAPEMATTHGVLDPITREPMGPTLESVVEPLGKDPEKIRQAFTYVVALRKAGRGLKATAGDPNELQAALDAVQALGQVPLYRKFAADLTAHLDAIGKYAVRSGLWTESQWEQLKHSDLFYIPFRRLMTHIEPPAAKTTYGVKRANLSAGIETFEGSRRFLANPVEAVAGYDARIIKRADAYRVGSAVIDALTQYMGEEGKAILTPLAANDPAVKAFAAAAVRRNLARSGLNVAEVGMVADLSAPQIDPHNPVIWRNRKGSLPPVEPAQTDAFGETAPEDVPDREYYLLNDPDLYKALVATRADSPLGNGALMAMFRIARRLMTVTTTGINPRFALGLNIARDVPQAIMQVPGIRPDDIAAATAEAAKAVVGSSDFADILARHGLGSASIYAHDINPEAAARRIAPVTKLQKIGAQVRKIGGWPLETAERVGAASDLVARLAAARAVQRNAVKAGATRRGALASAATSGIRATVNFNRRAGIPVLQFAEQSVPFFGASMRSMLRATEAVGEVPYRVLGAMGIVGLAVMAEWAITKNDKERRAQQVDRLASERSRFVQFGKYRWPLSQEMALVAAGVRMGLAQFTNDDPDSAEQLAQAVYNLLPPVASDLVQGDIIAPWPGWREVQEVAQNRQAYGNRPIIPERLADLPPALRRQESTSPTFDLMAALARKGSVIIPPLAETSPLAVEHVIRGFLQNMTPLLTMVTDAALSRTTMGKQMNVPVPQPLTAHPLNPASAFVVREPPSRTSSESWFYQRAREYSQGESAERMVGKMEDLAETPAGQARAATARRLGGGSAWGLSEDLTADVGLLIKEAQLTLKDYRESETDIRQQVNDGALAPQAARALLDSLTLERQHMLRETRNAMERLGVPSGARSSTGTHSIQSLKTLPATTPKVVSPYSPENPFKP